MGSFSKACVSLKIGAIAFNLTASETALLFLKNFAAFWKLSIACT